MILERIVYMNCEKKIYLRVQVGKIGKLSEQVLFKMVKIRK